MTHQFNKKLICCINTVFTVVSLVAVLTIGGLLGSIVVNFWFLYIIFLSFQWMTTYGEHTVKQKYPIHKLNDDIFMNNVNCSTKENNCSKSTHL